MCCIVADRTMWPGGYKSVVNGTFRINATKAEATQQSSNGHVFERHGHSCQEVLQARESDWSDDHFRF